MPMHRCAPDRDRDAIGVGGSLEGRIKMISTSYHALKADIPRLSKPGRVVRWLAVAPACGNHSAGDIAICVAGPAA
jgi:hypothetical protein